MKGENMKYKVLAIAVVLSLFSFLVAAPVAAHEEGNMRSGDTATVAKDETLDASAYLAGANVTVAGTVRGDVYCAGQNINISGTIEGDLICAGQSITVTGRVMGDVRVAGQTINLDGPVTHSLTAMGQNVTLTANAVVNDDATVYGSTAQIDGKVGRDLVAGGQAVAISGNVGRNVNVSSDKPVLTNGARIGGDLQYTSRNEVEVTKGAKVAGKTERHEPQQGSSSQSPQNEWVARMWGVGYWLLAFLFVGLVLVAIAPRTYKTAYRHMTRQGGWTLLSGLMALVLAPIVAVALAVTVIGIPLGVTFGVLWIVALAFSFVYSGYSFGAWITEQASWKLKWPMATSLGLGLVLLALVMMIPIVGGLITFLALVWGLGGIVMTAGSYVKHRNEPFPVAVEAKSSKKAKA